MAGQNLLLEALSPKTMSIRVEGTLNACASEPLLVRRLVLRAARFLLVHLYFSSVLIYTPVFGPKDTAEQLGCFFSSTVSDFYNLQHFTVNLNSFNCYPHMEKGPLQRF